MKKSYIHIQEPCHENWNKMTAAEQGRFCQSCSKTVTDFSLMSDTEILRFLSAAPANTCGRFAADQVNRELRVPATAAKKAFWAYVFSFILPLLAAGRVNAQKKLAAVPKTEQEAVPGKMHITGRMAIRDTGVTCEKIADTARAAVPREEEATYRHVTMGLIVRYDKAEIKDTVAAYVSKTVRNELFKVYPNPATKGKKVSLTVSKAGKYTMHLLDMDSKMIVYKEVTVRSKGEIVFLDIPAGIATGNYYLRLVQAGSGRQSTEKLVVR